MNTAANTSKFPIARLRVLQVVMRRGDGILALDEVGFLARENFAPFLAADGVWTMEDGVTQPLLAWSVPDGKLLCRVRQRGSGTGSMRDDLQVVAALTTIAGAAAGNPTVMGSGILAGSRSSLYSDFSRVRKISAVKERNVIYLDARLNHNQVYVEDEDFDEVYDFMNAAMRKAAISHVRESLRELVGPMSDEANAAFEKRWNAVTDYLSTF